MVLSQNKVLGVLCMKKANCDVSSIREIIRLLERGLKNLNKRLGENNLDKLEWYRVVI